MIDTLDQLLAAQRAYQSDVDVLKGERRALERSQDEVSRELKKTEDQERLLENVIILLRRASEYARDQARFQIEDLVTRCLQFIFESSMEFEVEFSESRNLPVAQFYVKSNYDGYSVKTKPQDSRGGGVVDIVSLALRVAFLEIHKPKVEGPLFLDEPGKHVSDDYIYNLGEFIKNTSMLFGRQIIMVTHNNYLAEMCDTTYTIDIRNGVSYVAEEVDLHEETKI